jgi:hypothetical protein
VYVQLCILLAPTLAFSYNAARPIESSWELLDASSGRHALLALKGA